MSAVLRTLSVLSLLSVPVLAAAQDPKPVREPAPRAVNARPDGPATVTAKVAGPRSFVITWDSVPGATGYDIGRMAPPDGWQRVHQRVGPNVFEIHDTGRDILIPHTYRVIAIVGNLASQPTLSDPVKGEPNEAMPGSANATTPNCLYAPDRLTMTCTLKKTWQGGAESSQGLEVGCPAGALLVTGGYDVRLIGYQIVRSAPRINESKWGMRVDRVPSITVSPTVGQEMTVVAACRVNR